MRILTILAMLAPLVALLAVGEADYKDAVREANHYCEMVNAGHWPNYENRNC